MFEFFKKKTSGKPKAAVFVDYEHWYYGYHNKVQMKPNVEEWIDELKQEYEILFLRQRFYIYISAASIRNFIKGNLILLSASGIGSRSYTVRNKKHRL